jgi:cytochrome c2
LKKDQQMKFVIVACTLTGLIAACKPSKVDEKPAPSATSSAVPTGATTTTSPSNHLPSVEHGKELIGKFECVRCHSIPEQTKTTAAKDCVGCHRDILDGKFGAAASQVKWKPVVAELADVPSLTAMGKRFSAASIEAYLLEPYDLRPKLVQNMPRLEISREDAKDMAAFLVSAGAGAASGASGPLSGDASKGRAVLDGKGCGSCHAFSGVAPLAGSAVPVPVDAKVMARAVRIAPDLRFTRDRFADSGKLVAWLKDPHAIKPDTLMPNIPLTDAEVNDVATYLLKAELAPPVKASFVRLPPLTRKVTFEEVDKKVFHRTCWHCHAEPDYAIGDGGPGNSGGFGFKARGLNLASYEGAAAGILDKKSGERGSVFAKGPDGAAMLLRSLLARHKEESGSSADDVRGMPLGMPGLTPEEIQLVETWILQGRPK